MNFNNCEVESLEQLSLSENLNVNLLEENKFTQNEESKWIY